MDTIAITGATSSMGISLVNECLKRGCFVIACMRKSSQHIGRLPKSDRLQIVDFDLTDRKESCI